MARDPQRIEKVLSAIRDKWYEYPDLRLGQLLINAVYSDDLFYIEEDKLIKKLNKFPKL
jgi:hypothetical protein